jgi:hypothetical protein
MAVLEGGGDTGSFLPETVRLVISFKLRGSGLKFLVFLNYFKK